MARRNASSRLLRVVVLSAALASAVEALAFDTGIRQPKPQPPDVVNCSDPAWARMCMECETGGGTACCRDPLNCVVIDAVSGAAFYYAGGGGHVAPHAGSALRRTPGFRHR